MQLPLNPNSQPTQETVDQLYGKREIGLSSEALLKIIDPMIEQRFAQLFDVLQRCPAELGPLLDVRAQITEVWRLRTELRSAKLKGEDAMRTIEGLLQTVRNPDKNAKH